MASQPPLTRLPPELLDHITGYLPTASSVSNFSRTSKSLKQAVEKDGWATFHRSRFPSLQTHHPHGDATPTYHKDVARTLVTLSESWDRRAFNARYTEPSGDVTSFPDGKKLEKWKRPKGQTIGFTPQLDSHETVGSRWDERVELLALSTGAEVCVRGSKSRRRPSNDGSDKVHRDVRWVTYRHPGAMEGKDDVTSLHIIRPPENAESANELSFISGTASGSLARRTLDLSPADGNESTQDPTKATFDTDGLPIRSTSLLQRPSQSSLLAANLGETRLCLYSLEDSTSENKIPLTSFDILAPQNGARTYRAWSTNFLSSTDLAVGLGPSEEPVHIYSVTPSGIEKEALRKFSLQNDLDRLEGEITLSGFAKKSTSSVYPIVPLPSSASVSTDIGSDGPVFLSGAYDGIVRLHDLRSDRQVEQAYKDPTDDSAIYSLLPRGREKLVVGTSRHSLLKVFDMRLGAKCYSYLDAAHSESHDADVEARTGNWNLFLKPHSATYPGRGGGNNWARRSAESSIYSLTSPSPTSPYIYAGVENAVVELAFTSVLDRKPDAAFFDPHPAIYGGKHRKGNKSGDAKAADVLDLAMYEPESEPMKLLSQRNVSEMRSFRRDVNGQSEQDLALRGLDQRWKVGT